MQKNITADVVVVGFGAAGAAAAIEAAEAGADVLVIERFSGGGTSAASGGIVYAGGGTTIQAEAGVADSVEEMYGYLKLEVGDAVSDETLRAFCEGSPDMITWLQANGVPFDASLCPYKTSYPNNDYYLYYSGSEASGGFRDVAKPAQRGHRVHGRGTSGKTMMAGMMAAARRKGVRILDQTAATRLITNDSGEVTGLEVSTLQDAPESVRRRHRLLAKYAAKPGLYAPPLRAVLERQVEALEDKYATQITITARRGVVLSAGGFVSNRGMMKRYAPKYRGGLPLSTAGDDGSAIMMGAEVGGATGKMDQVSAWRFIAPPSVFMSGIVVNKAGRRIIDESRYGAALGEALIQRHDSTGWLVLDQKIVSEAWKLARSQSQWFHLIQAWYLLAAARITGATVREVAVKAGIDPAGLVTTVDAYNSAAKAGVDDPTGKPASFVQPLLTPPYSVLDVSIRPHLIFPTPMITLGGLVVDEKTGAVLRDDGTAIAGLYAAGRSAVGICSNSYVSGLSLADGVFSGRRAGRFSAVR